MGGVQPHPLLLCRWTNLKPGQVGEDRKEGSLQDPCCSCYWYISGNWDEYLDVGRNTGKQLTFPIKVMETDILLYLKRKKKHSQVLTRHWLSENTNLGLTFSVADIAWESITAVQLKEELQIRNYDVCLLCTLITKPFQRAMKSTESFSDHISLCHGLGVKEPASPHP